MSFYEHDISMYITKQPNTYSYTSDLRYLVIFRHNRSSYFAFKQNDIDEYDFYATLKDELLSEDIYVLKDILVRSILNE